MSEEMLKLAMLADKVEHEDQPCRAASAPVSPVDTFLFWTGRTPAQLAAAAEVEREVERV
ncbi:hypothetical protein [Maricaulis sp.]|uniref:hypothetical protein n=1 Tax=Maricaulis sp. TaxID=1486257 RepID=UPI003297E916